MNATQPIRLALGMALLAAAGARYTWPQANTDAQAVPGAVVLDRAVAVVNQQVILDSEVEDEIRLSVLDPNLIGQGALTPQEALDQLISRALIQQQMREEDAESAEPSRAEVDARLSEIRKQLPACVHENCASDAGWRSFLAAHGLTPERVDTYLAYRLEILSFIELRFRPAINITEQEIENYYRNTLRPQYKPGETIPPLDQVSSRIEEILLEQQVNVLFDQWLTNLRKQGDVEVLDPSLEDPKVRGNSSNAPAGASGSIPEVVKP